MKSVAMAAFAALFFCLPSKAEKFGTQRDDEGSIIICTANLEPSFVVTEGSLAWCNFKHGFRDVFDASPISVRREAAAYCLKDYGYLKIPEQDGKTRWLLATYCANKLGIGNSENRPVK